ncbi:bifunctional UDP-N-acetylmuramoyl-tripeptide:D-alanyl-D-alanine ligase/alanine racemase [Hymenobacter taeanensis]|uniref:Alanine racemase n=1 Tax=Hymenobacter taeanensis TaxID=2735321 RepID=A0A6M6BFW7_9BACT|nr:MULTISPECIES: bifunctional UDP-N-acetylmuramoyl-tripeptide:D-alanyl-D-alanine ligase/alanine racemase [Hymenobacter]QJX47117.1 bifunctional UDP-N-acetylmuramoyl-tripeptide:D-alanyl-D-alanine ligase/alanine racemase [Hymenobacter taeanensis]UOQ81031.1 bifunctional UDP-N-acetylmuramoyl-tripeptide:D-alanyl-D-alanine ligase/alanine racemase [Hymenobacter sp. 5414T-23]
MLQFTDLPACTGGTLLQAPTAAAPIHQLLIDSRRVGQPAGALFFALRGPRHDGHRYLAELYGRGVRLFVIDAEAALEGDLAAFPEASFLLVPDVLTALQTVAACHRQQYRLPVVGITGSNGKTIVKEWLAQLLSPDELICKSPLSFNSQVGVPLSVWQLNPTHTLGIFEAGISEPGEMARLAHMIRPTLGLFTNLGTAHDAGFASARAKAEEKMQLFKDVDTLFYCADHALIHEVAQAQLDSRRTARFPWTRQRTLFDGQQADVLITIHDASAERTVVRVERAKPLPQEHTFTLPFADEPSVENALHGLTVLLWRQVAPAEIQRRLDRLQPVAMRLEMKQALNDCYVLDDTYNNDLAGLSLALDALARQPRRGRRALILSDVLESGLPAAELYKRVAAQATAHGVERLIGIGPEISQNQAAFAGLDTAFYADTEAFLTSFQPDQFRHETILVKGARRYGFERIVAVFQQKIHGTVLEVNLDALVHNLNFYRRRLQPGVRLMVMVKAFAYGSGSYEVANLLQFHRADYLAVAYTDEGVDLRQHGISLPIMVMNPSPDAFQKLRQYHLEPEIYSFELLDAYLAAAQEGPLPAIHLKLDTGMRRLGFAEEDVPLLCQLLQRNLGHLRVASALTHLAGADEAQHNEFSQQQLAAFHRMTPQLETALGYSIIKHALNSAGIVRFPEAQLDMVRLGIGLYGVEATGQEQEALRPVSTLRTTISQVKTLPANHTVGYGRRGQAVDHDRRIATLAIGYADGYDRRFGNGAGEVLIRGQRAPIIGNVCMDMCMVDVTHIPDLRAGDTAIIFGEGLTLPELAQRVGTIPYELLTNVSERVKRVFITE